MSLYQHNFTLLPVPPRGLFSHGNAATRYQLPDFATVAELQLHTGRLMIYYYKSHHDDGDHVTGFWTQLAVSASIVSVLIVLIALIIVRRMWEQSFWLLRVARRPTGTVIIPNTLLGFTLCEGVFAVVYVVFCWQCRSWYYDHSHLPHRYMLWITMTWYPLAFGPLVATYGAYFAVPSDNAPRQQQAGGDGKGGDVLKDDERSKAQSTWLARLTSHSFFLNALLILTPLCAFVSIAVPTVLAHTHHARALARQQRWETAYDGQLDFTQDMVRESQLVWFDLGRAMYIAAGVYAVWTAFALCLGLAYIWMAVRLLRVIRAELHKSEAVGKQLSIMATPFVVSANQTMSVISRQEDDEAFRAIEMAQWASRNGPQGSSSNNNNVNNSNKCDFGAGGIASNDVEMLLSDTESTRSTIAPAPSRQEDLPPTTTTSPRFAGLRSLVPNIVAHTAPHPHFTSAPPLRSEQRRALRKAYHHNLVQVIAIAPGCLIFACIALWCAISVCGDTEHFRPGGGSRGQDALQKSVLAVTWAVVVLGSVTVLAIVQRTYEPVLSWRAWNSSSGRTVRGERQVDVGEQQQQLTFTLSSAPNPHGFAEDGGFSGSGGESGPTRPVLSRPTTASRSRPTTASARMAPATKEL